MQSRFVIQFELLEVQFFAITLDQLLGLLQKFQLLTMFFGFHPVEFFVLGKICADLISQGFFVEMAVAIFDLLMKVSFLFLKTKFKIYLI